MAAPNYNYSGMTSAELWQEIRKRKKLGVGTFGGIDDKSNADDMVNALVANDEVLQTSKPELPDGVNALPEINRSESVYQPTPGMPKPSEFRHGYARRDVSHIPVPDPANPKNQLFPALKNGETFAVCKHEPNRQGFTVTCMNTLHTWQGTETQFRQFFTPVDYTPETKTTVNKAA